MTEHAHTHELCNLMKIGCPWLSQPGKVESKPQPFSIFRDGPDGWGQIIKWKEHVIIFTKGDCSGPLSSKCDM